MLFTVRNSKILANFNVMGQMAFNCFYKANSKANILHFIEEIVISGKDPMHIEGTRF